MTTIVIKIKVAWWVKYYLRMVALVAYTMRMKPDMEKVGMTVMRGIKAVAE